ncbi:unnamed protein product [Ectocarpus sp. 12 AP-2014]
MPRCVAPTCDKERPKKGEKGKCTRPNPWNLFRKRLRGEGFSPEMIREMYEVWIVDWDLANPGLTRSVARERMNETLCQQIAMDRPNTRFFAKRDVPPDWSFNSHIKALRLTNSDSFAYLKYPIKKTSFEVVTIRKKGVESLKPKGWFTDEVVDAYMTLLSGESNPSSKKCRFMSSDLYADFAAHDDPNFASASSKARHRLVKDLTRKKVTTGKVKIFVPVNTSTGRGQKDHWIMIMIDVENKRVVSMDSKGLENSAPRNVMLDWIEQEHRARRRKFVRADWSSSAKSVPAQHHVYDCGPFACMFAAFMGNEKRLKFASDDMKTMRARIAWSILSAKLFDSQLPLPPFFAKREVPRGWSLRGEISKMRAAARESNPGISRSDLEFKVWFTFKLRSGPSAAMRGGSVLSMQPKQWYTDEVIHPYMMLLAREGNPASRRCRFVSSYLFDMFKADSDPDLVGASARERHALVKEYTAGQVTTGPVKIFVPVNVSLGGVGGERDHWILIMIDVKNKRVVSMDSLGHTNSGPRKVMLDWIEQEHKSKRKKIVVREWTSSPKRVPRQLNGYDCGPFVCILAAFMSNDVKIDFTQEDLPKMRNRIAWSILNTKL